MTTSHNVETRWWHSAWLKWGAIVALLIGGFYVHQNLLGAMAWKKVQKDVAATGESLDPASLIPAPVPDERNFGALPIFRLYRDASGNLGSHDLTAALLPVQDSATSKDPKEGRKTDLPYLGRWRKGEQIDRVAVQKKLAELNHEPAGSQATPLQLYAKLCPALADLRAANATHLDCLFPQDPNPLQWEKALGSLTTQIKMAKVLAYEERLALDAGQPQLALDDLRLAWKINSGLRKEDTLIAGFVSLAMVAIQMENVRQSLAGHVWNEAQLAQVDRDLGAMDELADFQQSIRGEAIRFAIPLADYLKSNRRQLVFLLQMDLTPSMPSVSRSISSVAALLVPGGWLDQYKADAVGFEMLALLPMLDVPTHRVFPEKEARMLAWISNLPASGPWRNFVEMSCSALSGSAKKFAYSQVQIDQARLACRLERYRLVHGEYPETLAMLEPVYGPNPHDPVIGDPYHYHRNADGTYRLWSLGWNQKDDGGTFTEDKPEAPTGSG